MPDTFLISDTHFFHNNILKFMSNVNPDKRVRPFWDNVDDMNESIVKNWNSIVSNKDNVYHLGDVCFGNKNNLHIIDRLNGRKKLVMGNHEHFEAYDYLNYFDDVMGCKEIDKHILTHIPVHKSQSLRYRRNIHGHLHESLIDDDFYINVSCEQINYTPVPFESVRVKHNG